MSRYIDAEWVQDSLSLTDECKDCRRNVDQCVHNTIDVGIVCNAIDDAPSIDIVRCKECKYCVSGQCWNADGLDKFDGNVADDDFCSRGERREQ